MEAKELRIGNYVYALKATPDPIIIGDDYNIYFDRDYSPILINEEWIEKFGFEFFEYEEQLEIEDFPDFIYKSYKKTKKGNYSYYSLTNTPEGYYEFCIKVQFADDIMLRQFKYIHELQNLYFALTGNELQING